jgi:hypothetical protein
MPTLSVRAGDYETSHGEERVDRQQPVWYREENRAAGQSVRTYGERRDASQTIERLIAKYGGVRQHEKT